MGSCGKVCLHQITDGTSEKDGEIHHFDLCEDCYNEVTAEFRVPVDVEDEIELL